MCPRLLIISTGSSSPCLTVLHSPLLTFAFLSLRHRCYFIPLPQLNVVQMCFLLSPSKHRHQECDSQPIDINGSRSIPLNGVCARPSRDTDERRQRGHHFILSSSALHSQTVFSAASAPEIWVLSGWNEFLLIITVGCMQFQDRAEKSTEEPESHWTCLRLWTFFFTHFVAELEQKG